MAGTITRPIWITPAGNLGNIAENVFFQILLDSYNPAGGPMKYTVVAGAMPPGMQLLHDGTLQGIPVVTTVVSGKLAYTYTFTVRSTNKDGIIADRGFELTVTSLIPPKIVPAGEYLGEYYDATFLSIQLTTTEVNPEAKLSWEVYSGQLPLGITLDPNTGLLSGYAILTPIPPAAGLGGWNTTIWNTYEWDFTGHAIVQNKTYQFTIRVNDGVNFDIQTYTLFILSKQILTGDNDIDTIDSSFITIDTDNNHTPIITTPAGAIPTTRQESSYAFQFHGIDFDGNPLTYKLTVITDGSFDALNVGFDTSSFDETLVNLPSGLTLDPVSGWLTGYIGSQTADETVYTFSVYCYKTNEPAYVSAPVLFTLTVLGDINNRITWTSSSNLGTIDNGTVSMFALEASSPTNNTITYTVTEGSPSRLPQGLKLQPKGLISGRVTFEYFSLDGGTTTIDGIKTNFDNSFFFTVQANVKSVSGNSYITSNKTFSIEVNHRDIRPYENLYLKAFPLQDQRYTFESIVNNADWFPPQLIYRASDLWFGVAKDISVLFLPGLSPSLASKYIAAMANNHYTKHIQLSNVKTAVALDQFYNIIYEVVYVEVNDSNNYDNIVGAVTEQINLASIIANPYIDESGNPHTMYYPDDFGNMQKEVLAQIPYQDQGALPLWMKTPQIDGSVLGFTRALILAYTVPGASKLIAYRLASNGVTFNDIDFTIDRYILDNNLSLNYDIPDGHFLTAAETTFDNIPPAVDPIVASVNYAMRVPFDQINGQSAFILREQGAMDGYVNFKSGDTLIFAQQQNYYETSSTVLEPFDSLAFDSTGFNYSLLGFGPFPDDGWYDLAHNPIPGYLEHLADPLVPNQRAGVWRINIDVNDIVTLTFVQEISVNQIVQVNFGVTYGNTRLFYDPVVATGFTVPQYHQTTVFTDLGGHRTIFDGDGTRFFSNRDVNRDVNEPPFANNHFANNHYLKFPKVGVFK